MSATAPANAAGVAIVAAVRTRLAACSCPEIGRDPTKRRDPVSFSCIIIMAGESARMTKKHPPNIGTNG